MRESYGEGLATHTDPESCGGVRKGISEALTGECAGRVSSHEIMDKSLRCRCGRKRQKATPAALLSQDAVGPRAVVDPVHAQKLIAQELGDPMVDRYGGTQVRAVNPIGVRRR